MSTLSRWEKHMSKTRRLWHYFCCCGKFAWIWYFLFSHIKSVFTCWISCWRGGWSWVSLTSRSFNLSFRSTATWPVSNCWSALKMNYMNFLHKISTISLHLSIIPLASSNCLTLVKVEALPLAGCLTILTNWPWILNSISFKQYFTLSLFPLFFTGIDIVPKTEQKHRQWKHTMKAKVQKS